MDLTRRAALALPALVVAGCTTDSPAPEPAPVDPDVALARAAAEREQALVDALTALATRARGPRSRLMTALVLDHQTHLAALAEAVPATSTPSPTPSGLVVPPVDSPAPTLGSVRQLVRTTERAHAAAVLQASPRLAPVLASLAACEASHLAVL